MFPLNTTNILILYLPLKPSNATRHHPKQLKRALNHNICIILIVRTQYDFLTQYQLLSSKAIIDQCDDNVFMTRCQ